MKKQLTLKEKLDLGFKKNDLRGIYGEGIDEEVFYLTGKATVEYLKCKELIVGWDVRYSSKSLKNAFIKGIIEQGCNVMEIGMVDTPSIYFASGFFKKTGAIITASHNPEKYNGLKIVNSGAVPIGEKELNQIKKLVLKNNFKKKNKGTIIKKNISHEYIKHIRSFVNIKKIQNLKIVVDSGNGMAGKMYPLVFQNLNISSKELFFEITGRFPNHVPNPIIKKNLKSITTYVKKNNVDIGIIFDSDMDRVVFIDEKGEPIDVSIMACLIIKNYFNKKSNKKLKVIHSSTCSKIISEIVKKSKGKIFRDKVGHSYIKARMRKENADFGVEASAHYFFKKNFYADSGLIATIIVLQILSEAKKLNKTISQLLKEFKKYSKADEVSLKVKDRNKTVEKIKNSFEKKAKKIIKTDGFIFEFDNYWFSLRKSNTEPVVRINLEAINKKIMKEKLKNILKVVK